jgi:hypothetical protein
LLVELLALVQVQVDLVADHSAAGLDRQLGQHPGGGGVLGAGSPTT